MVTSNPFLVRNVPRPSGRAYGPEKRTSTARDSREARRRPVASEKATATLSPERGGGTAAASGAPASGTPGG